MHANELQALKPGPGLTLGQIPETVETVATIEVAHGELMKTYDAVLRQNAARRTRQELGVLIPDCEANDWRTWQATSLRRFHEIRSECAGRVLPLFEERLDVEAVALRQREDAIGAGLGKTLHDAQAGVDLALLLLRLTGGLPHSADLRDTFNRWRNVAETSRRALCELPPVPEHKPTDAEKTAILQTMLETKEIER